MNQVKSLGNNLFQIELVDSQDINRTTGYIIKAKKNILIETGTSPSNKNIHAALNALELTPADIDIIIVTHIHLDHAGGAGLLMQQCPNATLVVHPKGSYHLSNPDRLIAGARIVYGSEFDRLFNPILPVPEEKIRPVSREDIEIGDGRILKIFEAPGHALHHVCIYDSETRGIFSGDAAGFFYHQINDKLNIPICIPNTAPTQFDPDAMRRTYDHMISLDPLKLYFTHYGGVDKAVEILENAREWIRFFSEDCVAFFDSSGDLETLSAFIQDAVRLYMKKTGVGEDSIGAASLAFDCLLNAQGIAAYVKRIRKQAGA